MVDPLQQFFYSLSSSPNRCLAYLHIFIHLSLTSVALFVFLTAFTFSVMLFLLISEAFIKITFKERVCLNFVLNNVYIDYNYAEMLTSCHIGFEQKSKFYLFTQELNMHEWLTQ